MNYSYLTSYEIMELLIISCESGYLEESKKIVKHIHDRYNPDFVDVYMQTIERFTFTHLKLILFLYKLRRDQSN